MSFFNRRPYRHNHVSIAVITFAFGMTMSVCSFAEDEDISEAIAESDAATQAEIQKASLTGKTVREGLEAFRQKQTLQLKAVDLKDKLSQPNGLCQTMDTQVTLTYGQQLAKSSLAVGQKNVLASLGSNTNTTQAIETAYQASNSRFCSDSEVTRGVCKPTKDPKFSDLAGADQDAMFLFQSRSGASTYEGARDGAQVDAVNAYVKRVVVGVPPEQLRQQGKAAYKNNPQARAYIELLRRYNAFLSMSAYSLNEIKESHNPLK